MDTIPAITYHQVLSEDMPIRERKTGEGVLSGQIYLKDFIQHMDYLAEQGFTTITHDQLYQWQMGKEELGPKPIVIDFDDHSMISYINALPVMRERGQVATMYTISGVADGDPTLPTDMWSVARMRWPELEMLIEAGWEIGAHTRTHLYLTTAPEGSEGDAQVMRELVQGMVDIEINLGVTPHHFAYPNGLWDERVEVLVKQVYKTARHFRCYGCAENISRDTDFFRLPTMNVNYLLPIEDFQRLVNRQDPDFYYYEECRDIGHAGSSN